MWSQVLIVVLHFMVFLRAFLAYEEKQLNRKNI